jgi:hypothetical protein
VEFFVAETGTLLTKVCVCVCVCRCCEGWWLMSVSVRVCGGRVVRMSVSVDEAESLLSKPVPF